MSAPLDAAAIGTHALRRDRHAAEQRVLPEREADEAQDIADDDADEDAWLDRRFQAGEAQT